MRGSKVKGSHGVYLDSDHDTNTPLNFLGPVRVEGSSRGRGGLARRPYSEFPASATTSRTALWLPLWTREASGDHHCRSQSTGETVVWCSVLYTLTVAVTGGRLQW